MEITQKKILDPTCGSRMMWFQKDHPEVVYGDKRMEEHVLCDGRQLYIAPDVVLDFTQLPYEDESFYLVVFDPPHLVRVGEASWMNKKYGRLTPEWKEELAQGFRECMRVLKPNGTLVFKWNEDQIPRQEVLQLFEQKPLFGHTSGRHEKTMWMIFFKSNPQEQ